VPDVRIITAAIAYDDPEVWHTYILFYHHALYIPTMQRHLLNPNQIRANDVIVNETPLVLLPYDLRNKHSHSIVATTELHEELHIPLQLEGVTSFFKTRMRTRAEVEDTDNRECTHVHMTPTSGWDPHDTTMANHEASLRAAMNNEDSYARRQIVQAVTTEIENKQKITREVEATQREAKGTPTMCRPPRPMHRATKPRSTPQATQISRIRRQQENSLCIDIDSYCICILTSPPVLSNGTSNQYSCSTERPSIGKIQHPKGCCMELGNWSIKNQLGSTNSKGLPVLFQGSHQGLLLNN